MNCKSYNTIKPEENTNNYFLSITDNDTRVVEEMYLNNLEFKILDIAIRHNRGMINLLSNVETICSLFRKGLIVISNDELAVPVVSDIMKCILDPKATADFSENPFLEENRPNGFFKLFGNKSICFCCL